MAAIWYPQHAVHSSDSPTDTGANRCTNRTADRASHSVAFIGPFLRATHDSLRVPGLR
jgi:hypothetical protein